MTGLKLYWGCGDCTPDNPAFVPDDVKKILASACAYDGVWGAEGLGGDTVGFSVVQLKNGLFGVSQEWSDSSGHG